MKITPYAGSEAGQGGAARIVISSNESALGTSWKALEACSAASEDNRRYPHISARSLRRAPADHPGLAVARLVCPISPAQTSHRLDLAQPVPGATSRPGTRK